MPKVKSKGLTLEYVTSPHANGDERLAFLLTNRLSINDHMAVLCADERAAIQEMREHRFDGRQTLIEYFDAANEDSNDRLPHEPGYEGRWDREVRLAREAAAAAGRSQQEADAAVVQLVMRFGEPVAA